MAAAIFGDAEAVTYVALTAAERFLAVQTGVVDVLIRTSTWTQGRDMHLGLDFGPVTFYDGQQLMARAGDGFTPSSTVADIAGALVCANSGTTTEQNIAEAVEAAGVEITLNTFEDLDIIVDNFITGACDIMTTDRSGLVSRKNTIEPNYQEWVIFPPSPISKEPLAPVYAQNDSRVRRRHQLGGVRHHHRRREGRHLRPTSTVWSPDPPDAEAARLAGPRRANCRRRWDWPPTPSTRSSSRWGTTTTSSSATWFRWA